MTDYFQKAIDDFVSKSDSMIIATDKVMHHMSDIATTTANAMKVWIENHATESKRTSDGKLTLTLSPKWSGELMKHVREVSHDFTAMRMLPPTFLVSLISTFDAYTGHLLRGIMESNPDMLRASEKTLSYSELLNFKSFKDAKLHLIETEIDSVLRKSYSDQFDWLEKRIGIPLRKGLDVWPNFIEITERRHLFVHTGGRVTRQYIQVCSAQGAHFRKKPKIGEELDVDKDYFNTACDCLMEIGIKLGHIVWRKMAPKEAQKIDNSINNIAVLLITEGRYALAIKLLDFVSHCEAWKSTTEMKLYFELNLAQAYKWKGDIAKCKSILAGKDFAALSEKYKLARAVLSDDFDEAVQLMRRIGKKGEVGESEYADWPIFKEFRKKKIFEDTYREVFGEEFWMETKTPVGLEEHLKKSDGSS